MKRAIVCVFAFALLMVAGVAAQNNQHFTKDGLSFDYPSAWGIDESKTTGQQQYLTLGRSESQAPTIIVRSPRASLSIRRTKRRTPRSWFKKALSTLGRKNFVANGAKPERSTVASEIGGGPAECTRLSALLGGEPGRVDVCWRVIAKRMVQVAIVGSTRDITRTTAAWDAVRNSVKIEAPPAPTPTPLASPKAKP